jgi:hypothetical protein
MKTWIVVVQSIAVVALLALMLVAQSDARQWREHARNAHQATDKCLAGWEKSIDDRYLARGLVPVKCEGYIHWVEPALATTACP